MKAKLNVYELITERIVARLESGIIPWRKPWRDVGNARNGISKKDYRGINAFLLSTAGYANPNWLSFKQAQELGGSVKKGEKGWPAVFWKQWSIQDDSAPDGNPKMIPLLRYYTVFNADQCEGLPVDKFTVPQMERINPIPAAQALVDGMPNAPKLATGIQASYCQSTDELTMPPIGLFADSEAYYATIFHEMVHSTKHESRLNRKDSEAREGGARYFGSAPYAREELVAEMGAAFLCGHCGIDPQTIDNAAAYIQSWIKCLKGDPKLAVIAAAQAQRAADYITGKTFPAPSEETTEETQPVETLSLAC